LMIEKVRSTAIDVSFAGSWQQQGSRRLIAARTFCGKAKALHRPAQNQRRLA